MSFFIFFFDPNKSIGALSSNFALTFYIKRSGRKDFYFTTYNLVGCVGCDLTIGYYVVYRQYIQCTWYSKQ